MLTAKQILEKGIVNMSDNYPEFELAPAQIGIDLHMVKCDKLVGCGRVFADKKGEDGKFHSVKTVLGKTEPVKLIDGFWVLEPGVYEIGFTEGCKFDAQTCGIITHRSSVYRNSGEINSPWFDPGFETKEMGSFLYVKSAIAIEYGARVAQMAVYTTEERAEMYDGQWQRTTVQSDGTNHEVN